MIYKAFFDGACFLRHCGIGYVIRDWNGESLYRAGKYVGYGDALKAEYFALLLLLQRLNSMGIARVVVHGDSRTVVQQINGLVATRPRNRFLGFIETTKRMFSLHPGWVLKWVPRQENGMADALATESLNGVRMSHKKGRGKNINSLWLIDEYELASWNKAVEPNRTAAPIL